YAERAPPRTCNAAQQRLRGLAEVSAGMNREPTGPLAPSECQMSAARSHALLERMDDSGERHRAGADPPRAAMASALRAAIAAHYALSFAVIRPLSGGEECEVWLVRSDQGPYVVRKSPRWRSPTHLNWTHALMLALQPVLPAVIAPLKAPDG